MTEPLGVCISQSYARWASRNSSISLGFLFQDRLPWFLLVGFFLVNCHSLCLSVPRTRRGSSFPCNFISLMDLSRVVDLRLFTFCKDIMSTAKLLTCHTGNQKTSSMGPFSISTSWDMWERLDSYLIYKTRLFQACLLGILFLQLLFSAENEFI